MSDFLNSLLKGSFLASSEKSPAISGRGDLNENIDYYFAIHDEIMNFFESYGQGKLPPSKYPSFFYAMRDLSLQGENVLVEIATCVRDTGLNEIDRDCLFTLADIIQEQIAASVFLMDYLLKDNPEMRIVPLPPGQSL